MKDELMGKVNEIKNAIKDDQESKVVLTKVSEIINIFTDKLLEVAERQVQLEERVEDVFDMLTQIEEEMLENLNNEFEAECPYCGETITFRIPEDGEEFECPECGNVIEMELLFDNDDFDECNDGCGTGGCHGCTHHHEEEEYEEKHSEDKKHDDE